MLFRQQMQTCQQHLQQQVYLVLEDPSKGWQTHPLSEKWIHILMTWKKDLELLHIGRQVILTWNTNTIQTIHLQENHLHYPTIFALVMDILPIQGSSVPCKRVFSSAKETMTDRCSHIQPELMEGLQLLKYLVKHGHSLSFTAGCSWREEEEELKRLMVIDGDAPENLKAFHESLVCTKDKTTVM